MQIYELAYLILPSIAEDRLPAVVSAIKDLITKAGGQEIDGEEPFKMDLAYTMTKTVGASRYVVNDAYIGWIKFEAEPENLPALKTDLDHTNEIIRFLLTKANRETSFKFADAKNAMEAAEKAAEDEAAEASAPEEAVVE